MRALLLLLVVSGCSTSRAYPCATAMIGAGSSGPITLVALGSACDAPMTVAKTTTIEGELTCADGAWVGSGPSGKVTLRPASGDCTRLRAGPCAVTVQDASGTTSVTNGTCSVLD